MHQQFITYASGETVDYSFVDPTVSITLCYQHHMLQAVQMLRSIVWLCCTSVAQWWYQGPYMHFDL